VANVFHAEKRDTDLSTLCIGGTMNIARTGRDGDNRYGDASGNGFTGTARYTGACGNAQGLCAPAWPTYKIEQTWRFTRAISGQALCLYGFSERVVARYGERGSDFREIEDRQDCLS